MARKSPIPAGVYVEVGIDNIDDGRLRQEIDDALAEGLKKLEAWEKATDRRDGKYAVKVNIAVGRNAGSNQSFLIKASVSLATPAVPRACMVKLAGGRLLCQPEGASMRDPDQISLFDVDGSPKGTLDTTTGELKESGEPEPVAGRIAGAS